MTDTALRLIARDPTLWPSAEQEERVRNILATLGRDAIMRFEDAIAFIDSGGNWEGVFCPTCGDDAEGWWADAMAAAAADHFQNLVATTPCCNTATSLNDLVYKPPAGFARFVIEIRDPSTAPPPDMMRALEVALGHPLRLVWFHI